MICSKVEFQDFCNINRSEYAIYRKRGKIIEYTDDEGVVFIDTDVPQNKDFLQHRQSMNVQKIIEQNTPAVIPEPTKQNTPSKKQAVAPTQQKPRQVQRTNPDNADKPNIAGEKYQLELEKLKKEVQERELNITLKEQKIATIIGNNYPSLIALEMFARLGKSLLSGYKAYIDQEITSICHKYKISEKDRVSILAKMVTALNTTHAKSVNDARANMKADLKKYKIKDSLSDESTDD